MTTSPDDWRRLISALLGAGRNAEALAASDTAIAALPQIAGFQILKALALLALGRNDEAAALAEPLFAGPRTPPEVAFVIRGRALWAADRTAEAIATLKAGVAAHPNDAAMHDLLAWYCLSCGEFERGWREYEFRLAKLPELRRDVRRWSGEDLAGKRLLVISEQGLGDTLTFVRYLPALRQRGATVTAIVQPAITELVRTVDPQIAWSSDPRAPGNFDLKMDLLSLPMMFGTRMDTIPGETPYIYPDPAKVAAWAARIGMAGFKVGLAWQGATGPRRQDDRSLPTPALFESLAMPGVRLISLQGMNGLDAFDTLPRGIELERLGDTIEKNPNGIPEIAAVMANLDLIVSSDTMTAHLAGALGRPTWVGLKRDPDWRWFRNRGDSPWYPTMRLFRQETKGDWSPAISAMAAQLKERTRETVQD